MDLMELLPEDWRAQLDLNPLAMARLKWQVTDAAAETSVVTDIRSRLRAVDAEGGA